MKSSTREMNCGHPLSRPQPGDGEGPRVPAWQHSSLSWRCLRRYGSLQQLGSFHIPPADAKHRVKMLSHGLLVRPPPGRTVGRQPPRAKPTLAQGGSPGRTRAGMQVLRDTDPFGNTLVVSSRLQGLGFIRLHPQNTALRCLNCLGSPQSQRWEHPPALGSRHLPLPTQGCWAPWAPTDVGVMGGFPTLNTPMPCQEGPGSGCHPKQHPGPAYTARSPLCSPWCWGCPQPPNLSRQEEVVGAPSSPPPGVCQHPKPPSDAQCLPPSLHQCGRHLV